MKIRVSRLYFYGRAFQIVVVCRKQVFSLYIHAERSPVCESRNGSNKIIAGNTRFESRRRSRVCAYRFSRVGESSSYFTNSFGNKWTKDEWYLFRFDGTGIKAAYHFPVPSSVTYRCCSCPFRRSVERAICSRAAHTRVMHFHFEKKCDAGGRAYVLYVLYDWLARDGTRERTIAG